MRRLQWKPHNSMMLEDTDSERLENVLGGKKKYLREKKVSRRRPQIQNVCCFRCGKEYHQAICFKSVPITGAGGNGFSSNRKSSAVVKQHQWPQQNYNQEQRSLNYNQGQNSQNSFHPMRIISQGDTGIQRNCGHNLQNKNRSS